MFEQFIPLQVDCLADYADLIPGTLEAVDSFRQGGLKIGFTTGYLPDMMRYSKKRLQTVVTRPMRWSVQVMFLRVAPSPRGVWRTRNASASIRWNRSLRLVIPYPTSMKG